MGTEIAINERELAATEFDWMRAGFAAVALERGEPERNAKRLTFVADRDGTIAGCASGLFSNSGHWFYLTDLFVEKALRGCGIGTSLLAAIEARVAQFGTRCIWVRSSEHEAAGFYRRHGYLNLFELEHWHENGASHFGLHKRLA